MNNNQIDNTSYYTLPCGRQLEDFIAWKDFSFFVGSAVKYLWRAGNKDGESFDKDRSKAEHYIALIAKRSKIPVDTVRANVNTFVQLAKDWDGLES